MAQIDRATFKSQTDTLYADNNSGQITAADLRSQMDDVADSTIFKNTNQTSAPTVTDDSADTAGNGAYNEGDIWINVTSGIAYICLDATVSAAQWSAITQLSAAEINALNIDADTLDGQAGSYYTDYTDTAVAGLVDAAPGTLDTLNELAAALGDDPNFATTVTSSIADKLPLAGGTMTGDLSLGDNNKAVFGDGADLEIYHDGSNSVIANTGSGDLELRGSNLKVSSGTGSLNFIETNSSQNWVKLKWNSDEKLATTSTGVDVTGTVAADGLTVDGNAKFTDISPAITLTESDTTDVNTRLDNYGGDFNITTVDDSDVYVANRLTVDHATGDISFYEDTGTTPKFFWDASAESLGIGTSSPSALLDVNGDAEINGLTVGRGAGDISTNTAGGHDALSSNTTGSNNTAVGFEALLSNTEGANNTAVGRRSMETITTGSSNTAVGDAADVLSATGDNQIAIRAGDTKWYSAAGTPEAAVTAGVGSLYTDTSGGSGTTLYVKESGTGNTGWVAKAEGLSLANWDITETSGSLYFSTGGVKMMKLDSSGNLDIVGDLNTNATIT
jgi:hypothetical protein